MRLFSGHFCYLVLVFTICGAGGETAVTIAVERRDGRDVAMFNPNDDGPRFFFLEKGKEVGMSITIVVMEH